MPKYKILLPDWQKILDKKWVLIDSVAFNIMADYQASGLIKELQSIASCIYINPVLLEVMATDKKALLAPRLALFDLCTELPFKRLKLEQARELQQDLYEIGVRPSPTDLYLGSLGREFDNLYILTENTKDFPRPFFERVGYIVVETEKSSRLLSIIHTAS